MFDYGCLRQQKEAEASLYQCSCNQQLNTRANKKLCARADRDLQGPANQVVWLEGLPKRNPDKEAQQQQQQQQQQQI